MKTTARILIVDDVLQNRQLLRSSVSLSILNADIPIAAEFFSAGCAKEAIQIALSGRVNFIFLDIQLPDKSGLEILKIVKEKFPNIFVVMVSGENSLENVKQAIAAGASGFIVKPFTNGKISESLNGFVRYIRAKQLRQKKAAQTSSLKNGS